MRIQPLSLVAATVAALFVSIACACSVPVFRYALEQWPPDDYQIILVHRGPLSKEQDAIAKRLSGRPTVGEQPVNVQLTRVDLDADPEPHLLELWRQQETETLPLLVVQMPRKTAGATLWSGELQSEDVDRLLDSPLRREIGQRILAGHSAVWIYLEGGIPEQDDRNFDLITSELARLQTVLKLPEIDPADAESLSIEPHELKLQFSAVRLSRDDPDERFLVDMLLRVEPDLLDEEFLSQPMAFPVFGRGRALYALVGDGITAPLIEDASRFLTGDCQCTVKAENPGVDLIMAVDWDRFVEPTLESDKPLPPLAGLGSFAAAEEMAPPSEAEETATVTDAPAVAAAEPVQASTVVDEVHSPIGTNALFVAIGLLLAVVIATLLLGPRQR